MRVSKPIFSPRGVCLIGTIAFFVCLSLPARAQGLTSADYNYLQSEFGFGKSGFTLSNIASSDAAHLSEIINDPVFRDNPTGRRLNVAFVLFQAERAACDNWAMTHASGICPDVSDQRFIPGWTLAERRCIACHMTGTTEAPSFFSLARSGRVTEKLLSSALAGGHKMSPIVLSDGEIQELTLYINSLATSDR